MKKLTAVLLLTCTCICFYSNAIASTSDDIKTPIEISGTANFNNPYLYNWVDNLMFTIDYKGDFPIGTEAWYEGEGGSKTGPFYVKMFPNTILKTKIINIYADKVLCTFTFRADGRHVTATSVPVAGSDLTCSLSGDPNGNNFTMTLVEDDPG
ncbi:MAG: hypothetical protein HOK80_09290 [Candidatus Cloacimonetes bacterium]|jgi:hypothetical protein|nr:hypothetical protein [Candidatus Cloacimonadota bacterium]